MQTGAARHGNTAKDVVARWVTQLNQLFSRVEKAAKAGDWDAVTTGRITIEEDPFGLGMRLAYDAPVLVLKRPDPKTHEEQRITFEPRHRWTMGSAGRIDVYSYPRLRDVMLLRLPDLTDADALTWEQAEERVAATPWKVYSQDRLPLDADLADDSRLLAFLESLVE
jgi:hypothetical protein